MSHPREPIKYTCPEIDRCINWIKQAIVKDRDLKSMSESDLLDAASAMSSELESCIGYLEDLRKSNDTLRQWGVSEAENLDSLKEKIADILTDY